MLLFLYVLLYCLLSQPFQTIVRLYLLWSKLVTLFILWGDLNFTLHTGSTDGHGRRDILPPPGQLYSCVAGRLSLAQCTCECQTGSHWGIEENWGEIAGQSSPGGALGLVLLCVPGAWRPTQWGRWSANADCLRVVEYSRALTASFCDWCMPVCPYAFVFVMAHVCISLWPTFFLLTLHLFGLPNYLHCSICVLVRVTVYTCLSMCMRWTWRHLLTVMKGLEFAVSGEFIMTLIPLERYSLPTLPHISFSSLLPADTMCCFKCCLSSRMENIMQGHSTFFILLLL